MMPFNGHLQNEINSSPNPARMQFIRALASTYLSLLIHATLEGDLFASIHFQLRSS